MSYYTYTGPGGAKLHGYQRKYKKNLLRKKGFTTKGEAERDLRRSLDDIDARHRGEHRGMPTTCQDALDIYRRKLEVRGQEKDHGYRTTAGKTCKVVEEFVTRFGPDRLVREVTETDLRAFYQVLCFRMTRSSAASYLGRIQGMLKAAQESRTDLVNWLRPRLKVSHKTEYERRTVLPEEYAALIASLLTRAAWRDASDACQVARLTGGRLNEVLRMKLGQFNWRKGTVTLIATKTESERDVPLSAGLKRVVQARIKEGRTDADYLFGNRALSNGFDGAIQDACRRAAKLAGLDYGQAVGFTIHSLRHTFITDLMEKTGNDAGTVMKYSGHKSLASFSIYLHPTEQGRILATQALDTVDPFLILSAGIDGLTGQGRQKSSTPKVLDLKTSKAG